MTAIEEIKQKLDIVEVISEYLPMQKAGRNFKATCPFHSEKTPSFYVFPEQQSWHCFGACSTGGDVFSFVMKKENYDFKETLHLLAQRAGVSIEKVEGRKDTGKETKCLESMNSIAADYYHKLLAQSPSAEGARTYLTKRGLNNKVIDDFHLGFSPDSWDALKRHLIEIGYKEDDLVKSGLVTRRDQGGTYDRFRNRLMFPIRDPKGVILGFGARALDNSHPKYLNSPQTALFDKAGILYGLDRAKDAIRKQDLVVVTEGYMDVISAHQHGFENVVASMGTSLTERQVGNVKGLTKNLAFALDADTAGEMATQRGIEVTTNALEQKVVPVLTPRGAIKYENTLDANLKVIVLPAGHDPDEIIKENPQNWQSLVEKAMPVVDYAFKTVIAKFDLTKPQDKSAAASELQPLINGIKDPIRRAHYLQKLAHLVDIDERLLANALTTKSPTSKRGSREKAQPASLVSLSYSGDSWEEYCLFLLFHYPDLRNHIEKVSSDYFERSENRELFLAWINSHDPELLREELDPALGEHLDRLMTKTFPPLSAPKAEKAFHDCAGCLRERWLKRLKAKEAELISEAQLHGGLAVEDLHQWGIIGINTQLEEVFSRYRRSADGQEENE